MEERVGKSIVWHDASTLLQGLRLHPVACPVQGRTKNRCGRPSARSLWETPRERNIFLDRPATSSGPASRCRPVSTQPRTRCLTADAASRATASAGHACERVLGRAAVGWHVGQIGQIACRSLRVSSLRASSLRVSLAACAPRGPRPGRGPMVRERHTAVHANVAGVPQSRTRHERVLREDARLRATAAQSPACRRRGVRRYDSGAVGAPKFRATRSVGKRGWASLRGHGNRFFVAHPAHRTAKLSGPSDGRGALPACAPRPPNGLSSMPSQTSLPLRPRAFKQLSLWRHPPRGGGQPYLAPAFYLRKNAFRLRAFRRLDHLGNRHRSVRWTMSLAGTCCGRHATPCSDATGC